MKITKCYIGQSGKVSKKKRKKKKKLTRDF